MKPDTGRGLREGGKQHRPRRWVEHFGLLPCAVGVPESRVIATRKRVPPRQAPLGCTAQHPTHPQVLSTYQQEPARPLLAWQDHQQPQLMDDSSSSADGPPHVCIHGPRGSRRPPPRRATPCAEFAHLRVHLTSRSAGGLRVALADRECRQQRHTASGRPQASPAGRGNRTVPLMTPHVPRGTSVRDTTASPCFAYDRDTCDCRHPQTASAPTAEVGADAGMTAAREETQRAERRAGAPRRAISAAASRYATAPADAGS